MKNQNENLIKIRIAFLAGLFLMACAGAASQNVFPQDKKIFTIDEAIQAAIEKNAELQIARLETEKSSEQVKEAYGYALPTVTFDANYRKPLKKQVTFLPGIFFGQGPELIPVSFEAYNTFNMGFTATQILFNSAVFTGMGTAKIYQRIAKEQFRASYNKTVAGVKKAFYSALLSRQVVETTKASLQNAEDNLKNARIMNQSGIVSDYDMIRAEVQVENVRPMVIEAERNFTLALNGLKLAMNLESTEEIDVTGMLEYAPADSSLIDESLLISRNASLQALKHQKDFNNEIVTLQRSEYMPSLAAFGTYNWQSQSNQFEKTWDKLFASSHIGLTMTVNLFNGFRTTSKVAQAKKDTRKIEEQMHAVREGLRTQLHNIKYRLDESQKRIQSQGRSVELAEKGYRIAKTRYQTGSGTQLEVNDADVALLRARLNRVHAIYDYTIARIDLEEIVSFYKNESSN